jgi:lipopolysaccharide/colanic/teichoic acid biosynthesis glycosyltransferase
MNNVMRPLDTQTAKYIAELLLEDAGAEGALVQVVPENDNEPPVQTEHGGLPLLWEDGCPVAAVPSSSQLQIKRVVDVTLALAALLGLAPLLLLVAVLVAATSPGPILFRQRREGLGGRLFWTLKFRSMPVDRCDRSGLQQTRRNDPRLTPFGAFIRRTSIDELPQLLNVLWGEMSLVGPRPHVPGMFAGGMPYKDLVPYYDCRLAVRPGITGWAQANGLRGPTGDAEAARSRIEFDLAYMQNLSVWLDLRILGLTLRNQFLTGSGH